MKKLPTQKELLSLFTYSKKTGDLRWRVSLSNCTQAGSLIDGRGRQGHRTVCIGKERYYAHRIIWKMVTGKEPISTIDHKNRIRDDNRWKNLREATKSQQGMNAKLHSNNSSGVSGVCFHGDRNRWAAVIKINRKTIHLGRFREFKDACTARRKAELELYGAFIPEGHNRRAA